MARDAVRKASRAIRRKASEEAQRQSRSIRYAEVTSISPLTAEVNEGGFVLDDDDLVLSKWSQQSRPSTGSRWATRCSSTRCRTVTGWSPT